MPKASWGDIGGSPFEDELDDYNVYDGELPPKGVYRFVLKSLRLKSNRNDEPMLNGLIEIAEPAGSKKSQYNGYGTWFNLNVTKQGAPWVNNFLSSLVEESKVPALRKAFWAQKVMLDKDEPPNILSIATLKMPAGKGTVVISADCRVKTYNDEKDLEPKRFFRPTNLDLDAAETAADEDGEDWEDETDEASDDDAYNERADDLEAMTRQQLLKAAKAAEVSVKRGMAEDDIIEAVLEAEFPEEEPDEEEDPDEAEFPEEDEEPDEDEDEEEDEELEDEEEEPEPEPEPKRTRRTRAATKAAPEEKPKAATRSRRAAPAKEEPPARTRTGRRRKAGSAEPPF